VASTELQHSTDGVHFEKLAAIATTTSNTYNYLHSNLSSGTHFYRLLIRDKSGEVTYSKTVLLVTGNSITLIKGVKPTMASDATFVDIHSSKAQSVMVYILDITGRRIADIHAAITAGDNHVRVNVQMLSKGLYMLHVKTEDGVEANLRVVKQ
jgi:hypothetical protein